MSGGRALVMQTLAGDGERATRVADAICGLIVEGGKLGELETSEVRLLGNVITSKRPPEIWFDRLALAIDRGAFERMEVDKIVERILVPPDA